MDFDTVIAPFARADFFAEHHGRRFLHLPGTPGRFAGLLGWDDLNAILERHRLGPPRLKLAQDGRQLDPARYVSAGLGGTPRLDSGKLAAALAGGATLILDAVEELAPAVRDLSDSLRDAFHAGNYVNLYAGWFGQNGFDLHWDSQETIIVQLSGRKRWQIFEPTRAHPLQDDVAAPPRPAGPPVWDGLLEDGDALYIPRGWWHVVHPVNEPSLHLTFATVQPTGVDLVRWVAARMAAHEAFRADLPFAEDAEGQAALAERLRALVGEAIDAGAVADFRRRWEAESFPRAKVDLPGAPYRQLAPVTDESRIRLTAAHRLHFAVEGGSAACVANGVSYALPADLAPVFALLSDTESIPVATLARHLAPTRPAADLRRSIEVLARAGILLIEGDQAVNA